MIEIAIVVVALIAAFLAFRFIAGVVKFAVLAAIVVAMLYFTGMFG